MSSYRNPILGGVQPSRHRKTLTAEQRRAIDDVSAQVDPEDRDDFRDMLEDIATITPLAILDEHRARRQLQEAPKVWS